MVAIFAASNKGSGLSIAFPDVCKVPAPPAPFVPVPFPNIASFSGGSKTASKVLIAKKEAFTMDSEISSTSGDEAGTLMGIISSKNMDKAAPKKGSGKVVIEGAKVVRLTSMCGQNGASANAPAGVHAKPCQTKVLVAP